MVDLSQNRLVFASHNQKKIAEIQQFFKPYNLEIISAAALNLPEPEETGSTFEENALLKARAICQQTQMPTLADDSGLCIQALSGAPGIHTKRFAMEKGGFPAVFTYLEERLSQEETEAEFVCVLALMDPQGREEIFTGRCPGQLVFPPRGEKWELFNPIFQPLGYKQTLAELEPAEQLKISHRGHALEQLRQAYFA